MIARPKKKRKKEKREESYIYNMANGRQAMLVPNNCSREEAFRSFSRTKQCLLRLIQ